MLKHITAAVCAVSLTTACALAQGVQEGADVGVDLGAGLRALTAAIDAPGFSGAVVVMRGDETLFAETRGMANQVTGRANTHDTRFNMGSITKLLTAIAYVRAADDAGVADVMALRPGSLFPEHADMFAEDLTAADLMRHGSTVRSFIEVDGGIDRIIAAQSNSEVFELVAEAQAEPVSVLEGQLAYNNSNFVIVGEMAARLRRQAYEDVLRDIVIDPAGATSAAFTRASAAEELNLALGYVSANFDPEVRPRRGEAVMYAEYPNQARGGLADSRSMAAGGLYISAPDLAKIGVAILAGDIISTARLEALCTSQIPIPTRIFGLGCGGVDYGPGARRWGHSGGAPGIQAQFALYPDTGLSVAILSNHNNRASPVLTAFEEAYFGDAAQLPEGMVLR